MAATFQRARNEEQREARRQAILVTATAMLEEMPVSRLTLTELSRRVGLAKSNVLRYFESREDVLLFLSEQAATQFLIEVTGTLPGRIDPAAGLRARAEALATELASAFAADPILCELLSAQSVILEHNVSVEVALRHKLSARNSLAGLGELLRTLLPELDAEQGAYAAQLTIVLVGGFWVRGRPSRSVSGAYQIDASLNFLNPEFRAGLARALVPVLIGLTVQAGGSRLEP